MVSKFAEWNGHDDLTIVKYNILFRYSLAQRQFMYQEKQMFIQTQNWSVCHQKLKNAQQVKT